MIIAISECALVKLVFLHMLSAYLIVVYGMLFHILIDAFFIRDIIIMSGNYSAYYNKILFYVYLIFLADGLVRAVIVFSNEVGHVK